MSAGTYPRAAAFALAAVAAGGVLRGQAAGSGPATAAGRVADPESVRVTTDPSVTGGCSFLGHLSLAASEGLEGLRRQAVGRGADVLRLRSLDERAISADLYRCGPVSPISPPVPAPTQAQRPPATPSPLPSTAPPPTPSPSPTPLPERRRRKETPSVTSAERQRRASEELVELKSVLKVVEDPAWVDGCGKRGEGRAAGPDAEDTLRGEAVEALANVLLIHRLPDGALAADYYRCPRQQLMRIPVATPPVATPVPRR